MHVPILSIIIPVYNVEPYLERCMKSVLHQTLQDIEIILVDDGSPDNCPGLCDAYGEKDSRIRVIHKANGGLGMARNSGLEVAVGKYVAFLDSDDFVDTDFYEQLICSAEEQQADMCIAGFTDEFFTKSVPYPNIYAGKVFQKPDTVDVVLRSMIGADKKGEDDMGMSVWKSVYSRKLIERTNLKFVSERVYISEDIIFNICFLGKAEKVSVIDSVGYHYCHNENSLTTRYKKDRFEMYKKLYNYEIKLLKKYDSFEALKERAQSIFLANTRVVILQEVQFANANGYCYAWNQIRRICQDRLIRKVIRFYDYGQMPIKQRLFCIALRYRATGVVYLFSYLQNEKKKKMLHKSVS